MIPEFVGRLPVLATLEDLDIDALMSILDQAEERAREAILTVVRDGGLSLTFSDDALKAISRKAIARKTGARGLRSIMENILLDTMFDLPGMRGVTEVVINGEVAEGRARPL